jgi:hypothetical protein
MRTAEDSNRQVFDTLAPLDPAVFSNGLRAGKEDNGKRIQFS